MVSSTTFSPLTPDTSGVGQKEVKCPVCGSKKSYSFESLIGGKTLFASSNEEKVPRFDIRVCAECGVLYNRVKVIDE